MSPRAGDEGEVKMIGRYHFALAHNHSKLRARPQTQPVFQKFFIDLSYYVQADRISRKHGSGNISWIAVKK
jgi:hypothetical protein